MCLATAIGGSSAQAIQLPARVRAPGVGAALWRSARSTGSLVLPVDVLSVRGAALSRKMPLFLAGPANYLGIRNRRAVLCFFVHTVSFRFIELVVWLAWLCCLCNVTVLG